MVSPRPRVGFVVDHPKRDLPGGELLAYELAARGIDTFLVPQYEQAIDVPLLGLDAILVNYARPVNLELVRSYSEAGIAVYVLDTEGGILVDKGHNTPPELARYIRDSGFAELLSGYFFWGPRLHEAFVADGAMPPSRLHLTGCPRFDYFSQNLRAIQAPLRTGHILVNTNYPAVNPRFAKRAGDDRAAIKSVGYQDDYIDRLLDDTRQIMEGLIATVRQLSEDFPEQTIVVRPHPFEDDEAYRLAFQDKPNVEVDGTGAVFDALLGAKALLHLNCGTAIEAIMLGVVPYALEFINTEHLRNHASLPSRASRSVHSYGELADIIRSGGRDPDFSFAERYRDLAEPYFYINDGCAARRVADALAADIAREVRGHGKPDIARSMRASKARPTSRQSFQAVLGNAIGTAGSRALRSLVQPSRRDKTFALRASAARLERLAAYRRAPAPAVSHARHPVTGMRLASLLVRPADFGSSA